MRATSDVGLLSVSQIVGKALKVSMAFTKLVTNKTNNTIALALSFELSFDTEAVSTCTSCRYPNRSMYCMSKVLRRLGLRHSASASDNPASSIKIICSYKIHFTDLSKKASYIHDAGVADFAPGSQSDHKTTPIEFQLFLSGLL